jgi:transcriptional regulator with XRE-family HTH domain
MGQGLSLEELSGRCGIDAAPLSKLERGESNATVQTLDRVAKGLGVSLVELVDIREYRTGKLDENAWLDLQRQMGKLSPQQQNDILIFIQMITKWKL